MNNHHPLVTVLITNYNYASYLGMAIDSALNQTYQNVEVIVIDDGSTDTSQEVIKHYEKKVISVLQENQGQPSAFNAGFSISKGEMICLLDSDDVWLPQKVEEVMKAFQAYPNASVIYHKVQNINTIGTFIGQPWPPYQPIRGNIADKVVRTGGWWPFPPSTGLSFSRKYLDRAMNIPEKEYEPLGADSYLADLAPFFGDVVGVNQVLSLYRIHDSNHSKNWSNSIDRVVQYYEDRSKFLNQSLENRGKDIRLSLTNHYPYQWNKYKLGIDKNIARLSLLALNNPWELRFMSRLKTVFELWIEALMVKKIL